MDKVPSGPHGPYVAQQRDKRSSVIASNALFLLATLSQDASGLQPLKRFSATVMVTTVSCELGVKVFPAALNPRKSVRVRGGST